MAKDDIRIEIDSSGWDKLYKKLQNDIGTQNKIGKGLLAMMDTEAKRAQSSVKANAPWKDRTGRARTGLTGYVRTSGEGIGAGQAAIVLAHGVDYGVYLELAMQRRYAILEKTLRMQEPYFAKEVNAYLAGLVRRLG